MKVRFGLRNVYYAVMTETEEGETYATPKAIPGAVNLSLDADGESNPFYADDTEYYRTVNNNGYSGSLQMAVIPESFLTEVMGQKKDRNGVLFENADDEIKSFALLCEFQSDTEGRRVVFYKCKATRPSQEFATTEDTKEPQTETLNISISPRLSDRQVKAVCANTTESATAYANFFSTVYGYEEVV